MQIGKDNIQLWIFSTKVYEISALWLVVRFLLNIDSESEAFCRILYFEMDS